MRQTLPAVIVILVLAGSSARAHHSYPNFLLNQTASVEGEIQELKYSNPHVVMKIRTAEGVVYTTEWEAASWLQYNAHVTLTTFRVGDHVIVRWGTVTRFGVARTGPIEERAPISRRVDLPGYVRKVDRPRTLS